MAETYLIQIREGTGEPLQIELRPGVEQAPLSVGTEAAWRVRGAGVLAVHLYLYFDGRALFTQSADPAKPAIVNGRPVGNTWTPVIAPATITMGSAKLVFRGGSFADDEDDKTTAEIAPFAELPDDDQTVAQAIVRTVAPARPFPPGAFASRNDDESTRFAPIGGDGPDSDATRVAPFKDADAPAIRGAGAPAPVRPAAGVPWNAQAGGPPGNIPPLVLRATDPDLTRQEEDLDGELNATVFHPAQLPEGGASTSGPFTRGPSVDVGPRGGLPPRPPAPADKPEGSRLGREWRAAPITRKVLYLLLPPALGGAFWVLFGNDPQPVRTPRPRPAASSEVPSATGAAAGAGAPTPSSEPPSGAAPPAAPAAPSPVAPATPTPASASRATPPATPAPPSPSASAASDRRERTAADDVSTGQYDLAAQLYDQLAQEHPENPAFGEAARILRQKMDAGLR